MSCASPLLNPVSCRIPRKADMIAIMSTRFLDHLADLPATTRALQKGAQLFDCGDPVTHLHAVRRGEVHLLRRQPDGTAFVLQRAGPGAILAEASVMSETFHCAAEAACDSSVTLWPLAAVRARIAEDAATTEAFARHLAGEVRQARLRAEIASHRRVADRLDAWLAWHEGAMPHKGAWHRLAGELGVSPEALYRELARRRRAG
ncbi:MAG TPA: Crp/Fnr family transcriptional regulator [Rhodobacterales bacterium]|nr:Crp/Fnr family transcriptional regulator [Rhodobacterales bacterium]